MTLRHYTILFLLCLCSLHGIAYDFSLGADISWATEMENRGLKLYNYNGEEREATALMAEMGLDAVRLRVWVDPSAHGNYCNKEDLLIKAQRAKALGMDIMVDFHYSDWWADPGKQNIPAAWAKHKYKQMLIDVADHTKDVLTYLKDNGITPKWVQVGNETSNGMLWPLGGNKGVKWKDEYGKYTAEAKQYAGFFKAGRDAVKAVFPEALVIVHLDNGYKESLYNNNLDALRDNGAEWDLIGMSLYPYWTFKGGYEGSVERLMGECIRNINMVVKKYGTDAMIVETGYEVDDKNPETMEEGRRQLAELIRLCLNNTGGHCKGVFYWEPTCRPSQYKLGAFTEEGKPSAIMRAYTTAARQLREASAQSTNTKTAALPYDRPLVTIETSLGNIIIELYNETPKHRDNFLAMAKSGAMADAQFYRVIKGFMIQGGMEGEPETLDAEITYPLHLNYRGAVAAARAADEVNPTFKSSAKNFYIVWGKNVWDSIESLDKTYTVFGEVVSGLDVVEKIQNLTTDATERPTTPVTFKIIVKE